ncbi:MAG TPA: sugar ABC transporter substrate-binding protein [Streptosporangiaceae bacterium]|nr:sugar ABC transporter substrate-binding protein [Streptosporangiaceae bacterium]
MRRIRRVHAGLATMAIAGVLITAACGSSGGSSSAQAGSAGGGSGKYTALLKTSSQMIPSQYEGPTAPAKAPRGIKIAAITCYSILEGCVIPAEGIAKAAADIGWTERTYDGGGTPTTQNAQILNAVSWGAKVIALIAITPSAVQTGLAAAKKAGALIVSGSSGLSSPNPTVAAPSGDIWPAFDVSPNYGKLGQNLGSWIIGDSNGKADVAVYGDKEFDSINAQQAGIVPTLHGCGGCKISPVMYFSATQISSALGPEVVSYLRTNPSVNYIYGAYDPPTVAMVTAIQNAGLANQVKIASALGNSQNLHLVASGQVEAADAAYDNTYMGFAMVDQSIRLLDHLPLFQPLGENLPFQVLTKANLPGNLKSWTAPFNYQAQFVKLWKG